MTETTVQPYIFFDNNCREALSFYAKALGGDVVINTFGDSPMELPPEQAERVMHATLTFGKATIFASDGMPGSPVETGMRTQISISTDSEEQGKAYFDALAEGGTVGMPFGKQFWGDTFGMLTDQFGVKWMVNARE